MKPNELRIGNLLLDRGDKVLRLDYWDFMKPAQRMFIGDSEVHPLTEDLEYCKPIPLTEEWLLKFGFTKKYKSYERTDFMYIGGDYKKLAYKLSVVEKEIEYVHQLQNLYFALTGEELTKGD